MQELLELGDDCLVFHLLHHLLLKTTWLFVFQPINQYTLEFFVFDLGNVPATKDHTFHVVVYFFNPSA